MDNPLSKQAAKTWNTAAMITNGSARYCLHRGKDWNFLILALWPSNKKFSGFISVTT